MPSLIVVGGARPGAEFRFEGEILVGREQGVDFLLPDPTVSRRHARISPDGAVWQVSDLRTQNGTTLNGRRVAAPASLRDGDTLGFGAVTVRFADPLQRRATAAPAAGGLAEGAPLPRVDPTANSAVLLRIDAEGALRPEPVTDPGEQLADLQRRFDALTSLAGAVLDHSFDEQTVLELSLERLLDLLPEAENAFVVTEQDGGFETRAARARGGVASRLRASRTLLREVVAKRQAVVSLDASGDDRFRTAQSVTDLRIGSVICAPILVRGEVLGVLQVDARSGAPAFGAADLGLVVAFARQVGLHLAHVRLHARLVEQEMLDHDLDLARRVQRGLLPRAAPEAPGYRFAFEYQPALAVGGDFFAFLPLANRGLAVAAGDVSGKGVSAALYVARLSSDLRHYTVGESEPAAILRQLNFALIGATDEGMFVTACLACLDPATSRLQVASAGHPAPLVRDCAGRVSALGEGGGAAVGVAAASIYDQKAYVLEPGDLVLLYTDGVTEAMSPRHEQFGEQRLIDAVRAAPAEPRGVIDAVVAAVRAFAAGEPQSDDITLVCFGRDA